ncbi:MAG TPA: tRNA preQ1(34) S-adenosylmethionine ribosyltransferase-isomerase QueA [Bryobacteraceae bacterium]|nr:tRNA preQ1(34) S-adenosylmethionine ribosyltransferase-isomerase QueA [Bryobacteraceae bacterium]
MRVADFDFNLPEDLIAQEPLPERSASRMLVLYRHRQCREDRSFREFPQFIRPGDCLIVNDSRVFPSRLYATRSSGSARIEVFLLRPLSPDRLTWEALVRPGRKVPVGERLAFDRGLAAEVIERGEHGRRTLRFTGTADMYETLEAIGHVPLPPYIRRADTPADRDRYQTVFSRERGSVAAPTAGLHFTPEILAACEAAGARIAFVTLHVGLGTFAPVCVDNVEDVRLHGERFLVPPETLDAVRSAGRRVAAGTTSVRAIESAFREYGSASGETDIFIYPGHEFRAVDVLLTNFHLPRSTLLMLVCAFAGRELTLAAYEHAVRERYRFFSYGDCMLVL